MDGPQPLAFADMRAWAFLTGNVLRADEWSVILAVDKAYLQAIEEERPKPETPPKD